ncbi:prepilin-type N-terminal cleavage/methylation domain-containing protein [Actinoplanes sp. NPDC049681]|uniref:prepilin-type N-terminal cleavage/methylation domain-containing protein n=1 Tax=Actinoplanes sp. NPDC049681 TaxID=3363905 RepID=UPI0037987880
MQDIINRLRAKKDDEGFTLIELLVVVVIIGVLVAIAVPVYLNYRQGAADKSAQSDVRGAVSAVEQWYTDNGNKYPESSGVKDKSFSLDSSGTTNQITLSDNTKMNYVKITGSGTSGSYKICATNEGGTGKVYMYDSSKGGSVKAAAGDKPKVDDCAGLTTS